MATSASPRSRRQTDIPTRVLTHSLAHFLTHLLAENTQAEFFGERALLTDEPISATVVAGGPKVGVMTLKKDQFESLLGPLQARAYAVVAVMVAGVVVVGPCSAHLRNGS